MNRYLTFAVALAATVMVGQAADYTSGGISYNVISDITKTVCVVESSSASGDVTIPAAVTLGGAEYAVTEIGKQAFAESKLTSVVIPESILKIGDGAFMSCTKLKSVRYNATGCTEAGTKENSAFSGCTAITGVTLGENVTLIPPYIFQGLPSLRSIAIPRNVTVIGERAFADCTAVTEIYFDAAHCGQVSNPFAGCSNPFSMVISDNVEEVPALLCADACVTTVTVGKNVKSLKDRAFGTRRGTLETVYYNAIDAKNESTSSPFNSGYSSDHKIKRVVLGSEVKILPYNFMGDNQQLSSVEWNEKLEEIGEKAFQNCAFVNFKAPKSLKRIGDNAMPYRLSSVVLNEGLEYLSGFQSSKITSLIIPSTVKEIGKQAFYECSQLVQITGLENDMIVDIGYQAFYRSSIKLDTLKFGKNLRSIGEQAFAGVKTLHGVVLNDALETIGDSAFADTEAFKNIEFVLPDSLKSIGSYAFDNSGITGKLKIPNGLEFYGSCAFRNNKEVKEIIYNAIDANSKVSNSIGAYQYGLFVGIEVSSITIGEGVKTIGRTLFQGQSALEKIILPSSVLTIKDGAFSNCTNLSKIILNEGLQTIGDYAFFKCESLTEFYIPASVVNINGNGSFSSCTHLEKFVYNAKESTFAYTWSNPSYLTKFVLGESVEQFNQNFFTAGLKWVKWDAVEVSKYYSSGAATCPVIIGENVKTAVGYSFATVISNAAVPPTLYLPKVGATAYVPDKETYEEDPNWNKYILKQFVTWKGTIDGQKLEYTVNFPYELTLSHYLDAEGNIMPETPKEIGKYKAVFTYTLEDDEFELISPLEITANTANTMYIEPFRTHTGRQVEIPVQMVSELPITSFQFDIYLPEGLTLAKDEYGDYMVDFTDRKSNTHTISTAPADGGKAVRIAAVSMRNQTFSGLEGALLTLTVNVADDAPTGDAIITLRNIRLVEPSSAALEFYTNRNDVTISIGGFMEGDTNDDGKVTIADVVNTVNMVLGIQPDHFVFDAADLVKDGKITITDVVAVMNLAMNASADRPAPVAEEEDAELDDEPYAADETDDVPKYFESIENGYGLKVSEVKLTEGEDAVMYVEMENPTDITAFQFDLLLPEGITIPEDEWGDPSIVLSKRASRTHMLLTREQPDGALRIASYSSQNSPFRANSGDLVEITLHASPDLMTGNYDMRISFIEMSSPAAEQYNVPDFNVTAVVGTTGIEDLFVAPSEFDVHGGKGEIIITSPDDREVRIHTVSGALYAAGRVHEGLSKVSVPAGFYIVNGRKLIVK